MVHFLNLQRWMGAWKISFAGEAKEHALANVPIGPNLDSEAVPQPLKSTLVTTPFSKSKLCR